MSKLTLILDSSQLTEAQNCPRADLFSRIQNWEPKESRAALSKGGFFHDALKIYYGRKRDGAAFDQIKQEVMDFFTQNVAELSTTPGVETSDLLLVQRRIMEYIKHDWYSRSEWKILAIEEGFSVKLYEDSFCLYIYEGRIDLVVEVSGKRAVVDHKTQAMKYDWLHYSNQMMGYCYAAKAKYAIYNYIGLQQDVNDNTFRAQMESFREDQIERWRQDTIKAYDEILFNMLFNRFTRRRSGCINRFGHCRFYDVCKAVTDEGEQQILASHFKKREKPWRAWEPKEN